MVFRAELWKRSFELKSGRQVGGDHAQKRLGFEVTRPVSCVCCWGSSQEAVRSRTAEDGCLFPSVHALAPLLSSHFTLSCVIDGY